MNPRAVLLVVLVLIAALTAWLDRGREAAPAVSEARQDRSDFRLENFDLLVMAEDGLPRFRVRAPALVQASLESAALVQAPDVDLFEAGAEAWKITAREGWIGPGGEELRLLGDVELRSLTPEQIRARTAAVTVYPARQLARGEDPVLLEDPFTIVRGRGFRARLDTRKVELLADVEARYQPNRP